MERSESFLFKMNEREMVYNDVKTIKFYERHNFLIDKIVKMKGENKI